MKLKIYNHVKYLILLAGFCFCYLHNLSAQENTFDAIKVTNHSAEHSDSLLIVGMTFDISNLRLDNGNSAWCYPVVQRGEQYVRLDPLVINGRDRHILYQRLPESSALRVEREVARKNGTVQTVEYRSVLPWQKWMEKSEVALVTDLCGCGWETLKDDRTSLFSIRMAPPVVLSPKVVYMAPVAEKVKIRSKAGSAYLDFPVNRIEIYPSYRNNPVELARIRETVESVKNDPYATITEITIKGYASPEGSYVNNAYLAENRAKSLINYVKSLYPFTSETRFTVEFEPEDWEGLERRVEQAVSLPGRDEVLAVIRAKHPVDLEIREQLLKPIAGGKAYQILLRDIYPALRHSDYTVKYTIRPFTDEEARELLYTAPGKLSLDEMFRVARLYEPGSSEFNEVFEIAVRIYPDDPVSNLNAGLSAINTKQFEQAKRYLEKAADSPEKRLAEAALMMYDEKLDEAEAVLQLLVGEDTDVAGAAKDNLEQIRLFREDRE